MSDTSSDPRIGGAITVRGLVRSGPEGLRLIPVIALSPESRLPMEDVDVGLQGGPDLDRFLGDHVEARGVWTSDRTLAVEDIVPVTEDAAVLSPPPSFGTCVLLGLPDAAGRDDIDLSTVRSVAESLIENEAALHFIVIDDAAHFGVVIAAIDEPRVEKELRPLLGPHLLVVESQNTPAMLRRAEEVLANEDSSNNLLMVGEAMSPSGDYRIVGIVRHWTSALSAAPASALEVRAWIHSQESEESG